MSKRGRMSGGSVTGGTGDIKPQVLTVATTNSVGPNIYSVGSVQLPIPRTGLAKGRAMVYEILKVWFFPYPAQYNEVVVIWNMMLTTGTEREDGDAFTQSNWSQDLRDPRSICSAMEYLSFAGTTGGLTRNTTSYAIDLTDENGNGVLVATDKLYVVFANNNNGVGSGSINVAKILYRVVNVSIQEYIGIVQSQQKSS